MGGSYDNQKNVRIEHLEAQVQELLAQLEKVGHAGGHAADDTATGGLDLLRTIEAQRMATFNQIQGEKQTILQGNIPIGYSKIAIYFVLHKSFEILHL